MATLSLQVVDFALLTPTYAAAAGGGDAVAAGGAKCIFHFKNASGSSWVVTINDPTSISPAQALSFNPDISFTIPNAGERMFTLDPIRFTNPNNGLIEWTYSGVTSLTVGVFRLA